MHAVWVGRRLAYLGFYEAAIDWYSAALAEYLESYRLLRHRGHRQISIRAPRQAVESLERARELAAAHPNELGAGGSRVADLKSGGGTTQDQDALEELVAGKSLWLNNLVTDGVFRIVWQANGQRTLWNVNPRFPMPQRFGDAARDSHLGLSIDYVVEGGKIVEEFGNGPLTWMAYKSGDKTLLARSDEFGYANYEIIPVPSKLIDLESVKR